uniref:Uncharacterized protein n=1 Tax=Rhizophora mucronata TaxID=61149 RepID=A0A2P2PMM1_RHIMU
MSRDSYVSFLRSHKSIYTVSHTEPYETVSILSTVQSKN